MWNLIRGLFRTTTPDVNTIGLTESDKQLLPQFVHTSRLNVGPALLFAPMTYSMPERPPHSVHRRLGWLTILLLRRSYHSESYCICSGSHGACLDIQFGWDRNRVRLLVIFWFSLFMVHLDHSWEYPGKQGIGCNIVSKDDSANFLSFLQTLRSQKGTEIILSAAVTVKPFIGPDGNSMSNVSAFADVLDYIGSPFFCP